MLIKYHICSLMAGSLIIFGAANLVYCEGNQNTPSTAEPIDQPQNVSSSPNREVKASQASFSQTDDRALERQKLEEARIIKEREKMRKKREQWLNLTPERREEVRKYFKENQYEKRRKQRQQAQENF